MKKIISVSRRTDIPAFYGKWFMGRLKEGFAGAVNPFGGQKYIVSMKPQDVVCLVFWSKDFTPFVDNLKNIERAGYNFYFNYTVTCLPDMFENHVNRKAALETLKLISGMYSANHINWRFDPVIISSITDRDFYLDGFGKLAAELEGYVNRCYISFVTEYGKVKRNFTALEKRTNINIIETDSGFKIALAEELAEIAVEHGMEIYSCCGDYLVNGKVKKAHCIDGEIIEELFFPGGIRYQQKPTRAQCGCTESVDIGTYDSCPHGCVYCYANVNKEKAFESAAKHEVDSAFLGYSKADSDCWIAEIKKKEKGCGRLEMF